MNESITEYLDYRDYLYDFYKEKRKESSYFSYRFISSKVGVDPSHIAKSFLKKRHIPERALNAFVDLCHLSKKEADCFKLLVKFNKAKTDKEAKQWYEQLLSLKDINTSKLEQGQYEFFKKWYYSAILVLLETYKFSGDYRRLSNKLTPEIKFSEAKEAIELLTTLELIEKDKKGVYKPTDKNVTTGETAGEIAIKNYQQEAIRMASESLFRHKKEERDISTVTISVSRTDMPAVGEMIRDFRQALLRYSEEMSSSDSVYQLNIQMFPLSKGRKS